MATPLWQPVVVTVLWQPVVVSLTNNAVSGKNIPSIHSTKSDMCFLKRCGLETNHKGLLLLTSNMNHALKRAKHEYKTAKEITH